MDLIEFLLIGILFNLAFIVLSNKLHLHVRGIDSMPAIPIAAGFVVGAGAGMIAGAVLSITYHMMRPSTLGSLPLTFICSVIAGLLAALVSMFGFFISGIIILFVYHVISLILTLIVSEVSPGYTIFICMNAASTMILLIIINGVLGI